MSTIALTAGTFESAVRDTHVLLVDFWASWCGPCPMFAPIFDASGAAHPDVVFAKVDAEAEQALTGAAGITSIPTLMAFREGILVFAQPGTLPATALEQIITGILSLDMDQVRQKIAVDRLAADSRVGG